MIFIGNDRKIRRFGPEGDFSADSGTRLPPVRRPGHCGDAMQLTMQSAAAAGDSLPPGSDGPVRDLRLVWQCRCGFRLDPVPDPRKRVWAAAAAVEASQWEMDHAIQQLHAALRTASARGVTDELLAEWAQLRPRELKIILGHS
jgi:hypothetical protein